MKDTVKKPTINRRDFLRGATLLGGTAAAGWTLPHRPQQMGSSILDFSADLSPIDHIVVLMMENRSFDHYLGWLATDDAYLDAGRRLYGDAFSVDGNTSQVYQDRNGNEVATYYFPGKAGERDPYRGCGHPDPGHGWNQGRAERDGGFLTKESGNDGYALGYYRAEDLTVYDELVRRFTIFDHYHCSVLGPTFPNREYLHSAQSGGNKANSLPPTLLGFTWPTIWDKLAAAGVPAVYYYSDLPVIGLWGARMLRFSRGIGSYFADAAAGKLPNVVMIDPSLIGEFHNDDHPFADIRAGQKLVFDVFKAFVESPHWRSGLFIVAYDEWGGFFDHVAPPLLADDRSSLMDQENFGQAGFRVPVILASPYARPGFVDHRLYDHTSILRFIEWRFLGAPPEGPGADGDTWFLTKRDRNAGNIGASLNPDGFHPEVRLTPMTQKISRPCSPTGGGAAQPGGESSEPWTVEKSPFDQAWETGYFQAIGYGKDDPPHSF